MALRRVGQGALPAQYFAAGLAIAAGLLHFEVAPHHFQETFEFGLFMVVAGVVQVLGGVLLLFRPSRAVVGGVIGSTVLLLVLYVIAHTVGLPVGPLPWQAEHAHTIDALSKGTELALLWVVVVPLDGLRGYGRTWVAPRIASVWRDGARRRATLAAADRHRARIGRPREVAAVRPAAAIGEAADQLAG
jgi:hypothetical protein